MTTSISSDGTGSLSIFGYSTVSIILIPELKAILIAYVRENELVSPMISVLKPPFAEEQILISSFL